MFKQKVKEADVVIRWEFDGEVWAIADVQQIKQVLMNVILNAIEAVEKGGIIIIRGYYEEAKAVLQVEDNGRGMSEEEIHKMFEPFYSKKLNGVGLGLSVTYQLIQENNGEIRASSREGEGTVMTIWLPGCRKDENDVSCHGN